MKSLQELRSYKAQCVSEKKKNIVKLIFTTLFYILGIVLIIPGLTIFLGAGSPAGLIMVVLGLFACGGSASAKKALESAREQQAEQDDRRGYSVYNVDGSGNVQKEGVFYRIIFWVFGLIFGIIITPFKIIKRIVLIKRLSDEISRIDLALKGN